MIAGTAKFCSIFFCVKKTLVMDISGLSTDFRILNGPAERKKQEKSPKTSSGGGKLDISAGRSKYNVQKQASEEENWTFQPEEAREKSKSKPRSGKT